jgi:twitching motility two-component system response regulator PilG
MIRKDRALKGLPVIMLTSRSSPLDLARGALAGCNSYLVKPVAMANLRATVQRHLKRAQRRDPMATPVAVLNP